MCKTLLRYFSPASNVDRFDTASVSALTPFANDVSMLAKTAARELQSALQKDLNKSIVEGKMFGVLVVRLQDEYRYLCAFSGKFNGCWDVPGFVPPPFDVSGAENLLAQTETTLNSLKDLRDFLSVDRRLSRLQTEHLRLLAEQSSEHQKLTGCLQLKRARRKRMRNCLTVSNALAMCDDSKLSAASLDQESRDDKKLRKAVNKKHSQDLQASKSRLDQLCTLRDRFEHRRIQLSSEAQRRYFALFKVVSRTGSAIDVGRLNAGGLPPAGTGECAGAKLLSYAVQQKLEPVAMAEFWWGPPPAGEIRHHGAFYPSCRSKCGQLIPRLLDDKTAQTKSILDVPDRCGDRPGALDRSTIAASVAPLDDVHVIDADNLTVLYEDDQLAVIEKPASVLSVRGKVGNRSVYDWAYDQWPDADGALLVHRLDMDTSGILLIAKNAKAHRLLQQQFERREIEKVYIALLESAPSADRGRIELPVRPDYSDRPRQLVCHQQGKEAVTLWQVIERQAMEKQIMKRDVTEHSAHGCRVELRPLTGRTHQLRVHCAAPKGLNSPIMDDPMYGNYSQLMQKSSAGPNGVRRRRMKLHATRLIFRHPLTGNSLAVESTVPF